MTLSLRPYQIEGRSSIRDAMRRGKKAILFVMPTGAGKTATATDITASAVAKRSSVLFLVHRDQLVKQASRTFDNADIDHGIIQAGNPRVRYNCRVQIASVQTLVRRVARGLPPGVPEGGFDLAIVDEAHHAVAATYLKSIGVVAPNAYILGLTATPYRADGKGLGELFDELIVCSTIKELIALGFLVRPRVFAAAKPAGLDGVRVQRGDYRISDLSELVVGKGLSGDLVAEWMERAAGRPTIAFAVNVKHSIEICDTFNAAGIAAAHLDASSCSDTRSRVLESLGEGKIKVVSNCAILGEGIDVPNVSAVILARPTKSRSLWKQMVGRALRIAPGKSDCLLLDHAGCTAEHGLVEDDETLSLEKGVVVKRNPKDGEPKPCPECGEAILPPRRHCSGCGWSPAPLAPSFLDEADSSVELIEVDAEATARAARAMLDSQTQIYRQLCRAAFDAGDPPWVADREFRRLFKDYPPKPVSRACPYKLAWKIDPDTGTFKPDGWDRKRTLAALAKEAELIASGEIEL